MSQRTAPVSVVCSNERIARFLLSNPPTGNERTGRTITLIVIGVGASAWQIVAGAEQR